MSYTVSNTGVIQTRCIFHDDPKSSLRIWPSGFFKCGSCDKSGGAGDHPELQMLYDRVQNKEREAAGQMRLFG